MVAFRDNRHLRPTIRLRKCFFANDERRATTHQALPTALTIAGVVPLGLALRDLPVGTGYAVWTGIGTVGTVILGIYLFGDAATPLRLGCIGLIVLGIAGLKFVSYAPRVELAAFAIPPRCWRDYPVSRLTIKKSRCRN